MPQRRALLIDDEPLSRMELRRLLKSHPEVAVVGEAGTLNEARACLARNDYDLVFLDIQLRGGTGFDLLEFVRPDAHVIFVTAFDRFAVRAFEVNALDYLLKPVATERLASSLVRADSLAAESSQISADGEEKPRLRLDDRVFVRTGNATRFVPVQQIVSVNSNENYTELQLVDGPKFMTLRTLKAWEESLPESHFVRIHRQTLINLTHVRSIVRGEGDTVRFQFDAHLPELSASRRRVSDLRHRLQEAGLNQMLP